MLFRVRKIHRRESDGSWTVLRNRDWDVNRRNVRHRWPRTCRRQSFQTRSHPTVGCTSKFRRQFLMAPRGSSLLSWRKRTFCRDEARCIGCSCADAQNQFGCFGVKGTTQLNFEWQENPELRGSGRQLAGIYNKQQHENVTADRGCGQQASEKKMNHTTACPSGWMIVHLLFHCTVTSWHKSNLSASSTVDSRFKQWICLDIFYYRHRWMSQVKASLVIKYNAKVWVQKRVSVASAYRRAPSVRVEFYTPHFFPEYTK